MSKSVGWLPGERRSNVVERVLSNRDLTGWARCSSSRCLGRCLLSKVGTGGILSCSTMMHLSRAVLSTSSMQARQASKLPERSARLSPKSGVAPRETPALLQYEYSYFVPLANSPKERVKIRVRIKLGTSVSEQLLFLIRVHCHFSKLH